MTTIREPYPLVDVHGYGVSIETSSFCMAERRAAESPWCSTATSLV